MEKQCLECGAKLMGRADKKFCNDQCRNTYNNNLNKDANEYVRRVNVILRKNRRILSKLMPGDKSRTTKEQLLLRGFNFYYYTNIYKTKQGKTYYFVYELGYLQLENEDYALVRKQDYVK
ncbi:MAG: hypothetical protein CL853_06240 [Crocinitomicaceae bacterium]|nr:hypothetical protein [Crocinitomicaceae bacterium]|tara:strand:- start:778 stop:1137 length:360 start_codon:yes stop_codon:yes gene_type:complete